MATDSPFRAELDTAVGALGMQVTRDTVLQARAALLAEADRLDRELDAATHNPNFGVGRCGGDPVSADAQVAFNERIDALLGQCRTYNRDLREAAHALDAVAHRYGYTDDEIAASFGNMR